MKRFIVFLVVCGMIVISSEVAIGGITYPRNRVSIIDIELREFPWEQPLTSYPRVTQINIGSSTVNAELDDAWQNIYPLPFYYRVFVSNIALFIGIWDHNLSDYDGQEAIIRLPLRR